MYCVANDYLRNLRWLSPAALDLAEQLLAFDPSKRVTAAQALEAPYFHQEQPPAEVPVRFVLIHCSTVLLRLC